MHFISLIVSKRTKGNSDMLGRLAINEAMANGAGGQHHWQGELAYLKDYRIEECEGCLRCVFKNEPCHLSDDTYKLFDKIATADALFLVSPTYVLGVPGNLKLAIDKYLLIPKYYNKIYGRPAISVGIGGLANWNHFELPMLNLFLLGLGFRVIDSFYVRGAGPGEVLLNAEPILRLKKGIQNIMNWQVKPFEAQISAHCPVCFSTIFERIGDNRYRCPVCIVECEARDVENPVENSAASGKVSGKGFYFPAETLNNHRWTPKNVEDHFTNWILKTKDRFKKNITEIQKQKRKLGLE
ncbi:MAG: flavodoxin family protein [Candidatus Stahlbacteria bacterium]|nr:flavodoxin family protein [Candidatus Stahlbacteria bacterium]